MTISTRSAVAAMPAAPVIARLSVIGCAESS
ncbi:hypothetical protein C357_20702 [Citreicella sp. 357]|nr:hypothetical protein C357_20702 [Citreicella sp. 357]